MVGQMTLEEITLIRIGTTLWNGSEVKKLMIKNSSGLVNLEKVVALVVTVASNFPISAYLKNRLIDVIEKIGYELYLFLTKPYIECGFQVGMIKWTDDGLIRGSETLREMLQKTKKYTISEFRFSCELFDESLIREIWRKLDENERNIHREANDCYVYTTYWTSVMEHDLPFLDSSRSFIIGFKRSRSLEVNMLWHSIAVSNHAAVRYFRRRLQDSELAEFGLTNYDESEQEILQFLLKHPNDECLSFILSFLEMPIVSEKVRQLIVDKMNGKLIKSILDHLLRRINICGDLHYKIFRYLLYSLRFKWTVEVRNNLHLYALNLLSRGRIEKFDFLPENDVKPILLGQLMYKLKCKRGLAIFVTIHWNNYTHLLSEFFDWLADEEDDKNFFREFVSAIVDGRQYDT